MYSDDKLYINFAKKASSIKAWHNICISVASDLLSENTNASIVTIYTYKVCRQYSDVICGLKSQIYGAIQLW